MFYEAILLYLFLNFLYVSGNKLTNKQMKLTFLFLMCFASYSWQQSVFWPFTPRSYPLLYPNLMVGYDEFQDAGPIFSFPESRQNFNPNTPKVYTFLKLRCCFHYNTVDCKNELMSIFYCTGLQQSF